MGAPQKWLTLNVANDLQLYVQETTALLQRLTDRVDQLSDAEQLPFAPPERRTLVEVLQATTAVLAGAEAVLAVEVKRWGL